jgi:hypothetical protein
MRKEGVDDRLSSPKGQELLNRIRLTLFLKELRLKYKQKVAIELSKSVEIFKELPNIKTPEYSGLTNEEVIKHQRNRLIAASVKLGRESYKNKLT